MISGEKATRLLSRLAPQAPPIERKKREPSTYTLYCGLALKALAKLLPEADSRSRLKLCGNVGG